MYTPVSELMKVFEKMVQLDCRYCYVCLRMENEKKLIVPDALKTFVSSLNNKNIDFTETTRVCVICEEKAKAAVQFLKAARLAISIQELYNDMLNEKSYRDKVRQHFSRTNIGDHFNALNQVEEQLMSWRAHTEYVFTEVLTVDNMDFRDNLDSSQSIPCSPKSIPMESELKNRKTETGVTDVTVTSKWCSNSTKDDTVIVSDDDEVIEVNTDSNGNENESSSSHRKAHVQITHKNVRKRRRLNPVISVTGGAGQFKVRKNLTSGGVDSTNVHKELTIRNDSNNGQNSPLESLILSQLVHRKENDNMQIDAAQSHNTANVSQMMPKVFIQPTVCSSTGNLIFPSLPGDGSIVSLNTTNLILIPRDADAPQGTPIWPVRVTAEGPQEPGLGPVQMAVLSPLPGQVNIVEIPSIGTKRSPTLDDMLFRSPEMELVKEPVPKQVKIDWEDKIPMDVISFTESNNRPAASEVITGSSVGGITDVRSITDMMQGAETPTVVDLCYLD